MIPGLGVSSKPLTTSTACSVNTFAELPPMLASTLSFWEHRLGCVRAHTAHPPELLTDPAHGWALDGLVELQYWPHAASEGLGP